MAKVIRITDTNGNPVEFEDEVKASGSMKDAYFSPKRDYAVVFYRDEPKPGQREGLELVTGAYRRSIFEQDRDESLKKLYCWPYAVVEYKGHLGVVTPFYDSEFFFKYGSVNNDVFGLKGKEKEGKWFASARLRKRIVDPRELGDYSTHIKLCLQLARSVHCLHAAGLAHSDLSYKNILVDPTSGRSCLIVDADHLVIPGQIIPGCLGTPDFLSPEEVVTQHLSLQSPNRKHPDRQTNLHALAVLIYMYLLYRHPLKGSKVHHDNTETDLLLSMGEKALFIEHPGDTSNRVKTADLDEKEMPWADTTKIPYSVTGPYLSELFLKAFVEGLHNPSARPTAGDWCRALEKTLDRLQPCRNPSCSQQWFVIDDTTTLHCPFCGTEIPPNPAPPANPAQPPIHPLVPQHQTAVSKQRSSVPGIQRLDDGFRRRIEVTLNLPGAIEKTFVYTSANLLQDGSAGSSKSIAFSTGLERLRNTYTHLFKVLPRQGKEYAFKLDDAVDCAELKRCLGGADLSRLEIHFPEGLGLEYRASDNMIAGTPKQSGEFEVEFATWDRETAATRFLWNTLQVNPDPESLWNHISSEGFKGTPGWKEDQETRSRLGPQGRILAARIRGKSHAHVGSPCDNDMFVEIQDGWHILIVADGAGSAKLSRLGSQLAVLAAGKYLVDEFTKSPQMAAILQALESENPKPETLKSISQGSVGTAAYKAFVAILEAAKADGRNYKDLSTTLLVAMARQLSSGRWFVSTFWIGDGALALYRKGRDPILFGTPDSGEYSGQTRFLDSESVSPVGLEARIRFQFVEGFDAIVLMTGGVTTPELADPVPLPPEIIVDHHPLIFESAWDNLWTELVCEVAPYDDIEKASERLLSYLKFRPPGSHDDRTIAILLPSDVR